MLQVSAHNNGAAVCLLVAAAILKWGVPEHIRTDCGKEYLSRRVQRFLANLDVDTEDLRCSPGHPEQKPFVERFNRTFQHRDLVKSPFFIGHNVGERQALRASSSRDRSCIQLAMSVEEFQRWCDLWRVEYEQRPHGRTGIGLEGKFPLEVLAEAVNGGADINLAEIAHRARHLYEILLRSVNQIRKRGKALLRKLAADPYLLIGQTAQELTQVIQSQLHDYPAIQAVTAAIAAAESTAIDEPLAIELEHYHQELQRLEAESAQQALE